MWFELLIVIDSVKSTAQALKLGSSIKSFSLLPERYWDFILGRTGRAGAHGCAYTFFTSDKYKYARDLITILREANQEVPDELRNMDGGGGGGGYGGGGKGRRW